jgi:hypothetical protein
MCSLAALWIGLERRRHMDPQPGPGGLLIVLIILDLLCIPLALLAQGLSALGADGPDQWHPATAYVLARACIALAIIGPVAGIFVQRQWPGQGWWAALPAIVACIACWVFILSTGR